MASEILINVRPIETRIAVVENGAVTDFLTESRQKKGMVGAIFRGKVLRVLPGMNAAFVDVGLDRAAFLYAGDAMAREGEEAFSLTENATPKNFEVTPIQDLLSEGQSIMVQVAKDPLGTKGARITTHITLPGRFVVYMPTVEHFGISRRIETEEERERLKEIVQKVKPDIGGLIVRTAAEGASLDAIKADVTYLSQLYEEIKESYKRRNNVGLLHTELDVELRTVRDFLREDVTQVLVDDERVSEKVDKFIHKFMPSFHGRVSYYNEDQALFDKYEVDLEVSRSLGRKVWLKSGGYIVVDEAEALVVIDVNTGSYVGKKDFEETILKTNLEAAKEICAQLRLRNCGGIIIIDFIDMTKPSSREQLLTTLEEELKKDRVKTNVLGISDIGLVQMTRKRVRPSLMKTLCEPCSYCDGKGFIKSKMQVAYEIFRDIEREGVNFKGKALVVHCHPDVAGWIYDEESEMLELIEGKIEGRVIIKVEPEYHLEQFEISPEVPGQ